MDNEKRISLLDGFRAIAIIAVILFHFFSCYLPPITEKSLYPYDYKYDYFNYGYMGVQFFFIISGFVIYFTLTRTDNLKLFWINRFKRLYPSMIIASVIIFVICSFFDVKNFMPEAQRLKNFSSSITFLPPTILKFFIGDNSYINGAFWSLWPEIKFYIICSVLYFINKEKFLRNFIAVCLVYFLLDILFSYLISIYTFELKIFNRHIITNQRLLDLFSFSYFLIYFGIGVLFFSIYDVKEKRKKVPFLTISTLILFVIIEFYYAKDLKINLINTIMFLLFGALIYYPKIIQFLRNKYLVNIGISSYFLYLIHGPLAILAIDRYSNYFKPLEFIFPILLFIILAYLSFVYTVKVEKSLKSILFK